VRLRLSFLPTGIHQLSDRNEAQPPPFTRRQGCEEEPEGYAWRPDAVVEDDDGSGNQVFLHEPADIADRRVHRIVRVGTAEDARTTALPSQFDLPWPRNSAGRTEELQAFRAAERSFGLLQVANELGVRVAEGRGVPEIMVSNLVRGS
jgi:hypothetical protein